MSLPPLVVPAVSEEREQFFYLFLHVGSFSDPFAGVLGRLHARVDRPPASRPVGDTEELAREFDKHAGRAGWDLTQRLDGGPPTFRGGHAGRARSRRSTRSLDAADRADDLRHAAVDERDRHATTVEAQRALAGTLAALDEGNS